MIEGKVRSCFEEIIFSNESFNFGYSIDNNPLFEKTVENFILFNPYFSLYFGYIKNINNTTFDVHKQSILLSEIKNILKHKKTFIESYTNINNIKKLLKEEVSTFVAYFLYENNIILEKDCMNFNKMMKHKYDNNDIVSVGDIMQRQLISNMLWCFFEKIEQMHFYTSNTVDRRLYELIIQTGSIWKFPTGNYFEEIDMTSLIMTNSFNLLTESKYIFKFSFLRDMKKCLNERREFMMNSSMLYSGILNVITNISVFSSFDCLNVFVIIPIIFIQVFVIHGYLIDKFFLKKYFFNRFYDRYQSENCLMKAVNLLSLFEISENPSHVLIMVEINGIKHIEIKEKNALLETDNKLLGLRFGKNNFKFYQEEAGYILWFHLLSNIRIDNLIVYSPWAKVKSDNLIFWFSDFKCNLSIVSQLNFKNMCFSTLELILTAHYKTDLYFVGYELMFKDEIGVSKKKTIRNVSSYILMNHKMFYRYLCKGNNRDKELLLQVFCETMEKLSKKVEVIPEELIFEIEPPKVLSDEEATETKLKQLKPIDYCRRRQLKCIDSNLADLNPITLFNRAAEKNWTELSSMLTEDQISIIEYYKFNLIRYDIERDFGKQGYKALIEGIESLRDFIIRNILYKAISIPLYSKYEDFDLSYEDAQNTEFKTDVDH